MTALIVLQSVSLLFLIGIYGMLNRAASMVSKVIALLKVASPAKSSGAAQQVPMPPPVPGNPWPDREN